MSDFEYKKRNIEVAAGSQVGLRPRVFIVGVRLYLYGVLQIEL